jgi:hypothetical protein
VLGRRIPAVPAATIHASAARLAGRSKDFSFAPRTEAAIAYCIAITGIIYAVLLAPADMGSGRFFSFENMVLHYVGPAAVFVDWLLFASKGRLRATDPLRWLLIPLSYFIYILVRSTFAGDIGTTGSRFPYDFIDPAAQGGWGGVFASVGVIALGMAALAYLIYFIDRLTRHRAHYASFAERKNHITK